ncbi:MAG: hypothetical protein ACXVXJ_04655 [Mycobacteriaceae bacterium]
MRTRTTAARGYGTAHVQARKAALARLRDGDPCVRCGGPMYHGQVLHLDHDDHDRTKYLGLAHARCNTAAGGRASGRARRAAWARPSAHNPSQAW